MSRLLMTTSGDSVKPHANPQTTKHGKNLHRSTPPSHPTNDVKKPESRATRATSQSVIDSRSSDGARVEHAQHVGAPRVAAEPS